MSVRDIQRDSVIPNETGIITRKLKPLLRPLSLRGAESFYAMLAVEYICDSSYQVRRRS